MVTSFETIPTASRGKLLKVRSRILFRYASVKRSSDFAKGISARSSAQSLRRLQLPKSLDVHRLVVFLRNLLSTEAEKGRFLREVNEFLEEFSEESSASSSSGAS